MKRSILTWASALVIASGLAMQACADTILNTFDTPRDYVLNGIIGETAWDGVYLRLGDVVGGQAGGSPNGTTQQANTSDNPGFLSITTSGTDWSGVGDDGFFLFKVVSGDFDMSVEIVNPYDNRANNFCGLLARAYQTNNTGAPFSTNTTPSENWVALFRMNQFNDDGEIRQAINAGNAEHVYGGNNPSNNIDVNTTRFLRITRTGDLFSFYLKTNDVDSWIPLTNAGGMPTGATNRADMHGEAMQVGIAASAFTTAQRFVFFDNFSLTATNISATQAVVPGTPSNIITTDTNIGGSLTLSWTVGTPGESSLVVMKRAGTALNTGNIQVNPVQGLTYLANSSFGVSNSLIGSGESVVYNGTGNSVTVTNLGANNINYTVAVYEYTNTATGPSYNTASPTTASFPGPGQITGAFLTASSTNVQIGGATSVKLTATFSTGEILDKTGESSWSSSDPTIASIDPTTAAVTGVAPGTVTITGTFGTNSPTIVLNVTTPFAFNDNFTSTNDYVANGIINSVYDGLFLNFGDVPGTIVAGGDGSGFTPALNSQINSTNGLYMSSVQSDWEGTADDGPFLFKIVPGTNSSVSGDFEAVVHINNMNTLNGSVAGLMARCFNQNNATNGGRGPGNAENHVNYWKVQNGTTSIRVTRAGTATTIVGGPAATDGWLMIQRASSTNFSFFERATTNDQWILVTNTILVQASNNAPMEVGVANQATTGVNGVATFDSFSLDAAGIVSPTPLPLAARNLTMTLNGDLSMTLNWVAADGSGNPVPSLVVMRQGAPVSAQPPVGANITGNSVFKSGSNLGAGNYVVFVSANPPASTNNTVTVTGLTSGQTYYATVYTYAGSGATRVINPATGATGNLIDAAVTNILPIVAVNGSVPRSGIGAVTVLGMTSGGNISISTAGAVYSVDNTNIIQVFGPVVTGVTNGTANLIVTLGGFSNATPVTVRDPSFSDEFAVQHDYLVDGVTNTPWDGLYNTTLANNPVPGSAYVGLGNGTTAASSPITNVVATGTNVVGGVTNITYATNVVGGLNLQSVGDGWENGASGGFFLFKYVPGNFQMAVHIQSFQVAAFNQPGILARGYAISNGVPGYPLGYAVTNGGGTNTIREYWVDLTRFDEFGIGTYARRNIDGTVSQNTQTDQGDGNFWLLITRSGNGSEFDFYKRAAITDPWRQIPSKQHYSIAQFSNRPMQVGVMGGSWNGTATTPLSVTFEHFMLDTTTGSAITIAPDGLGNLIVSWPNVPGTLEHTTTLNPPNWQPVAGTPVSTATGYSLTVPGTPGSNDFFRLKQ